MTAKFLNQEILTYNIKNLVSMIDRTFIKKDLLFVVTPARYRLFNLGIDSADKKLTVVANDVVPTPKQVTSDTVRTITKDPAVYAIGAEVVYEAEVLTPKFDNILGTTNDTISAIKSTTKDKRWEQFPSNVLFIVDDSTFVFYNRKNDSFTDCSNASVEIPIWGPNTSYPINFRVKNDYKIYECLIEHESNNDFTVDLTSGKWRFVYHTPINLYNVTQAEYDALLAANLINDSTRDSYFIRDGKNTVLEDELVDEWAIDTDYVVGKLVHFGTNVYECIQDHTSGMDFETDVSKWKIYIGCDISTLSQSINNIILDTEIRIDKGWSSSKIYNDIQQSLTDSKTFTLSELGKKVGTSYSIATTTSEMTRTDVIYLLDNAGTFDVYMVTDDAPVKIGDMNVDLSQYYSKTETDNTFLKKTDAEGKYASLVSVNGKVAKTDILKSVGYNSKDTEIISAKTVYEIALEGILVDTTTVYGSDIINFPLGRYRFSSDSFVKNILNLPVTMAGILTITSITPDKNSLDSSYVFRTYEYEPYEGGTYIRKITVGSTAGVISTDTGWKRLCTTGATDAINVDISVSSPSIFSVAEYFRYSIKNGLCIIDFGGITSNISTQSILASLPFTVKNRPVATLLNNTGDKVIGIAHINSGQADIHFSTAITNEGAYGQMICTLD